MLDQQQFQNLVAALLSHNDQERGQAEEQINLFSQQNPDNFTHYCLNIVQIEDPNLLSVRTNAIVMLKKNLVIGKNKTGLYCSLSQNLRSQFQIQVLTILNNLENQHLINQLSDLISDVASSLYNDKSNSLPQEEKWGNLINHLFDLYKTGKVNQMIASLRIIESIIDQTQDKLQFFADQFQELFKAGFANSHIEIQYMTAKTLMTLVIQFKASVTKNFKPFSENILNLISSLIHQNKEDYLRELVSKFFDVCLYSPHFIKRRFKSLIAIMSEVRKLDQDVNGNLKIEAVECLVNVIEKYSELIEEDSTYLNSILELSIQNMLEIEDEVPEEWANPPDGFNDDFIEDDDQKIIKVQMDNIDKLLSILGHQIVLPVLQNLITKLLSQNNWKMSHAAVMIISQIGEYISTEEDETQNFVNILEQQSQNPNPRVRYAVCHALGQFADDQSPEFQDQFHEQYFKITLPLLKDPVPRVVAHCLASMTNFLEHCIPEYIQPHFEYIYQSLIYHLNHGITFVKEACLSTLSALAEGSNDIFAPHYDESMQIIFTVFQNSSKPEFKQLVGNAIECGTIIAKLYEKEKLAPYQNKLIEEMIRIQVNGVSLDGPDPQKSYLIAGWQRICTTVEGDLIPYLQNMMPSLLRMSYLPLQNETEQKGRISDHEECEIAVQLINLFLQEYPVQMIPYIQEIYQLIILINEKVKNMETKSCALGLLPSLIETAQKANNFDVSTFAKQIFATLWEIFVNEEDSSFKSDFCYFLQQVLQNSGKIFNKEELQQFLHNIENELRLSEERRQKVMEDIDEEEETRENIDFNIKCEHTLEDDFKLEIANLFGKVFLSHKQDSLDIFHHLYQNHIIPCFSNKTKNNLEYGLYLIDDSLENLGEFIPENILQQMYQILMETITSPHYDLKQSAAYGLGLLAQKMKIEQFKEIFSPVMQTLINQLNEPKTKDHTVENYETFKDNVVSSYGKSFEANWQNLDTTQKQYCVSEWIKYLPLMHDAQEGKAMNQLLMKLLQSQEAMLVYGQNYQNLMKLFEILKRGYYQKGESANQEFKDFITSFIKNMSQSPELMAAFKNQQANEEITNFLNTVINK